MAEPIPILVAEDSPTQAEQLRYLLDQAGYQVTVAANGRDALAAARASRPALVVSDINMPEMDGYELCAAIKADPALAGIPVILLTSLTEPDDVLRGIAARADGYCTKPYEQDHILSRVRFHLDNPPQPADEDAAPGVEINSGGVRHVITSGRREILTLLLSSYENAVRQNRQLALAHQQVSDLNRQLEEGNKRLQTEIIEGQRREIIIRQQTDEMFGMSTPVLDVGDGVVVAPLLGSLDDERLARFTEVLLQRVATATTRVALLDITGVPVLDTHSAQALIDTVQAVRLLGVRVILTGVRPAIAQTLVHLGIDLDGLDSCSSLATGLRQAVERAATLTPC